MSPGSGRLHSGRFWSSPTVPSCPSRSRPSVTVRSEHHPGSLHASAMLSSCATWCMLVPKNS